MVFEVRSLRELLELHLVRRSRLPALMSRKRYGRSCRDGRLPVTCARCGRIIDGDRQQGHAALAVGGPRERGYTAPRRCECTHQIRPYLLPTVSRIARVPIRDLVQRLRVALRLQRAVVVAPPAYPIGPAVQPVAARNLT
jgi:hypothetical protein